MTAVSQLRELRFHNEAKVTYPSGLEPATSTSTWQDPSMEALPLSLELPFQGWGFLGIALKS